MLSDLFRRRSSSTTSKPTTSFSSANTRKKNASSPESINNTILKPSTKTIDKVPLLEQTTNTMSAPTTKRKLIPERTVQIADVNSSRFISSAGTITTATITGQTGTADKETSPTSSEAVATSSALPALKPASTVADSGIYGVDLNDDAQSVVVPTSSVELPKIYGMDLPDKLESTPPVTAGINSFSENSLTRPSNTENTTLSNVITSNDVTTDPSAGEKKVLSNISPNDKHLDETVKSAYSNLIDATVSENEGPTGVEPLAISTSGSRRTSNVKQPLLAYEPNNISEIPNKITHFNPLHVILKKDANKYYTTEYI